jgi:aspartate aminotransferase/aromatic-amino-acid transaminase
MNTFNSFSDNVMAVIAFSCSKALTSYGLRCGAAVILAQKQEAVREAEIVFEKTARAVWSNIPNAAMENFVWIVNEYRDAFLEEKQKYVDLMKQRADIFLREAKEVGLATYPYMEGFFVTLKMPDNETRAKVHQALMDEHIYTVMVNLGIRVAICSLPLNKAGGLAAKIKSVEDRFFKEI